MNMSNIIMDVLESMGQSNESEMTMVLSIISLAYIRATHTLLVDLGHMDMTIASTLEMFNFVFATEMVKELDRENNLLPKRVVNKIKQQFSHAIERSQRLEQEMSNEQQ